MSSPPVTPIAEKQAREELESYILGGQYGRPTVPRNLVPRLVDEFIRKRVNRRSPPRAFDRSRFAGDWYDLQSLAAHFEQMLDRTERGERAFDQSLGTVALVGTVGNEEQIRHAASYFDYLADHPVAPERFDRLVETFEVLSPNVDPTPLERRMAAQLRTLKPGSDDYERVDQVLHNDLPRAVDEARIRRDVLKMPSAAERISRLARLYAGWDEVEGIELTWWAARWLRRTARAGQGDAVIAAFRSVLADVQAAKTEPDETLPFRTRILRAIRFLRGPISDSERRFLERSAARQWDVLDIEEGAGG